MIDQQTIDRIFAAADIVEVIGEFVNLKKAGQNYKARSPFTDEKTPSFFVSPSKGIFKCFSSGVGGNAVKFLMEHEKLTYPEALRYLAKKYSIDIHETGASEEDAQQQNERESLHVLNAFAQKYFSDLLLNDAEGRNIGLSYFKERGVSDEMIKTFQLGYSSEKRDKLTLDAQQQGYKLEYLVKTGLSVTRDDGSSYDRFSGRVMFPIHNLSGKVIGFGGRILKTDIKTAKYLNSPESDIYHKSQTLYGIFFAKQSIIKHDKCYLVEGYTDVISMYQQGIENVVASSGTALTVDQIRLIKRFTQNITIIYDGDAAGIKASLRGIDMTLEENMNVKVLLLPDGEDPDSYSKKVGATELKQYISQHETDFITFKTHLLLKEATDPVNRANVINDIVKSISMIPDGITRTVYIRECSTLLDIHEQVLYTEVGKLRRKKIEETERQRYPSAYVPAYREEPVKQEPAISLTDDAIECEIIRTLLNFGNKEIKPDIKEAAGQTVSVAEFIVREIKLDDLELQHPKYKKIFDEISTIIHNGKQIDEKFFIGHHDDDISSTAASLLTSSYFLSKIWKKKGTYVVTEEMNLNEAVPKLVYAFKAKLFKKMEKDLREELKKAENVEKVTEAQTRYIALNEFKKFLAKKQGDRIII